MEPLELTKTAEPHAQAVEPEELEGAARSTGQVDYMQLAFWGLMLIAVAAACVAVAWPSAGGATWPVTMIAMGAFGLV
ncbi:MAG: hypothetical protein AAFS13_04955, partial [Pseudomonadota bacterium]